MLKRLLFRISYFDVVLLHNIALYILPRIQQGTVTSVNVKILMVISQGNGSILINQNLKHLYLELISQELFLLISQMF
jgi:hypothetical protein